MEMKMLVFVGLGVVALAGVFFMIYWLAGSKKDESDGG